MIGEVARLTGRTTSAIRYYERRGLVPQAARIGGRRHYEAMVVRTLAVIDTAQRAGLALEEIRLLLEASRNETAAAERLKEEIVERRLRQWRTLIEQAETVSGWLELAAACTCSTLDDCPLFDEPSLLPEREPALPRAR